MTRTHGGGVVGDVALKSKLKYQYFPILQMAGVISQGAALDTTLGVGTTASLQSELSVAGSELTGFAVQAVNAEVYFMLDRYGHLWDCDFSRPIHVQFDWEHGSADADTPSFTIDFKGVTAAEAISDAKSTPDLTLTYASVPVLAVAGAIVQSGWKSTGVQSAWASDKKILGAITCTNLGSASANEIKLLGLMLRYTPEYCNDDGAELT